MKIIYSKQAVKTINRMDSARKRLVKEAIEKLPEGDTKQIHAGNTFTRRLRVGARRCL
jgi:mRNA-degrading endonuclease RelE of RelBE toxin-antitoxin system